MIAYVPQYSSIWDGNKDMAIEDFWKIQQLAALEGDILVALGFWLWKSLKENSKIWMWFTTLPFSEQAKMRTHYLHYLKGIKDNYLGRSWQINMNWKYENQSFCQEGFERESPPAFIVWHIMYTQMLVASDDGGPMEVYLVMQKAPISWGPILNLKPYVPHCFYIQEQLTMNLHWYMRQNMNLLMSLLLTTCFLHCGGCVFQ